MNTDDKPFMAQAAFEDLAATIGRLTVALSQERAKVAHAYSQLSQLHDELDRFKKDITPVPSVQVSDESDGGHPVFRQGERPE